MSQNIRSLAERTAQAQQLRASVDVDRREASSFILPGIVTVASSGVYTVAVQEADGQPSLTNVYTNVFPLLPGGEFQVNDGVALLFQPGETVPAILATGGTFDPSGIVYLITGNLGFTS